MLIATTSVLGTKVEASGGSVGKIHDLLIDGFTWEVRYLELEVGSWLSKRRILLSPEAVEEPDWPGGVVRLGLSRQQIEDSPEMEEGEPLTRRREYQLSTHYNWQPYWQVGVPTPFKSGAAEDEVTSEAVQEEPDLRSARDVRRYQIEATDGNIGRVSDYILDDEKWILRYLVVDTGNWLPGRKVLVSPAWIESVDRVNHRLEFNLSREQIKESPPFDPSEPVNREYERQLHDYYGRPRYWK